MGATLWCETRGLVSCVFSDQIVFIPNLINVFFCLRFAETSDTFSVQMFVPSVYQEVCRQLSKSVRARGASRFWQFWLCEGLEPQERRHDLCC